MRRGRLTRASGLVVSATGFGLVAGGLWARREVRVALERERIVMPDDSYPVTSGEKARSLAEVIRTNTLDAAEGKTYAETELFLDTERRPTSDRGRALEDDRSGEPVENPAHALWIQSTALQTALMQAYMGSRIADLTMGLGGALIVSGIGLSASALEAAR